MNGSMKRVFVFALMALFIGVGVAAAPGLSTAISGLCTTVKTILPTVALLMIIAAGVLYAAGQFMGAETRARASVWATAMLTGAIFAILIAVVVPWFLGELLTGNTAGISTSLGTC